MDQAISVIIFGHNGEYTFSCNQPFHKPPSIVFHIKVEVNRENLKGWNQFLLKYANVCEIITKGNKRGAKMAAVKPTKS